MTDGGDAWCTVYSMSYGRIVPGKVPAPTALG